jgi:hypothetical protein
MPDPSLPAADAAEPAAPLPVRAEPVALDLLPLVVPRAWLKPVRVVVRHLPHTYSKRADVQAALSGLLQDEECIVESVVQGKPGTYIKVCSQGCLN